mmetsp:Transcript_23262/g.59756  ORF Transcript_23262/g.59756 Transcript_23262/m.59756 type:complete len:284 (-) Transcript_23262:447-1298(-)
MPPLARLFLASPSRRLISSSKVPVVHGVRRSLHNFVRPAGTSVSTVVTPDLGPPILLSVPTVGFLAPLPVLGLAAIRALPVPASSLLLFAVQLPPVRFGSDTALLGKPLASGLHRVLGAVVAGDGGDLRLTITRGRRSLLLQVHRTLGQARQALAIRKRQVGDHASEHVPQLPSDTTQLLYVALRVLGLVPGGVHALFNIHALRVALHLPSHTLHVVHRLGQLHLRVRSAGPGLLRNRCLRCGGRLFLILLPVTARHSGHLHCFQALHHPAQLRVGEIVGLRG